MILCKNCGKEIVFRNAWTHTYHASPNCINADTVAEPLNEGDPKYWITQ